MWTLEFGNEEVKNKDTLWATMVVGWNITGCNLAKFQGSGWKKQLHGEKKKKDSYVKKNPYTVKEYEGPLKKYNPLHLKKLV